jgi:HK97 family phage major capsid protein
MTEVSAAPEGAPPAAMADAPSEGVAVVIAEPSIADPSPAAQQSAPVALQRRAMSMAPDTFDTEARTVDAVLSAGSPVSRRDWEEGDYTEILDMNPRSIRMDRMNRGAPILDSHDYWGGTRAVVGAVVPGTARAEGGELRAKIKFSRSPEGERVMQDVRDGVLRHLSVGYLTHGYEVDKTTSPPTRRATDWEPHEASVVAIPADPKAGFRALDTRPQPSRKDNATMEPETRADPVVKPAAAPSEADIAARADALVKAELDRRDQIVVIAKRLRLPDEFAAAHVEAKTSLDAFRALAIEKKSEIETTESVQSPVGDGWEGREQIRGFPTVLPNSARKTPEPGQRAAQMELAVAAAKRAGVSPVEISTRRFGADSYSTRALQASLGATGGYLIPIELSSELIELLRPKTVVRRACPSSRQISLPRGNLTIGRQNTGATVGYVGEGQSTAYTQETVGEITFQAKKAKAIVPISNDLIRFAQTSADMIVRDDLVRQLAVLEDQNFLRGVGSSFSPKGLRYLAATANVTTATLSYSLSTVISDLGWLVTQLENAAVPMTNPVWFFSAKTKNYLYDARDSVGAFQFREEMDKGRFRNYPYYWTQNIPSNLGGSSNQSEVYLVDMDEFIIADVPGLMIDASQEASYSSDGSTLTNSAFDRDETVIRIIAEHDCNIKHTAAIGVLTAVPYGN